MNHVREPKKRSFPSMDTYECADGTIVSLSDILGDDKIREVFQNFLIRSHMGEVLAVWTELEKMEIILVQLPKNPKEKEKELETLSEKFVRLCQTFFLEGCENPVSVSFETAALVLQTHTLVIVGGEKKNPISFKFLGVLQEEIWGVMCMSCLPPFIMSGCYQEFLDGKIDSTKVAFSRVKAEQFFGADIQVFFCFNFCFNFLFGLIKKSILRDPFNDKNSFEMLG